MATIAIIASVLGMAFGICSFLAFGDYLRAIFASIQTDMPTEHFRSFECPATLATNEVHPITVDIANPTGNALVYRVAIYAPDFSVSTDSDLEIVISGNDTAQVSWIVKPRKAGYHPITVSALSETDLSAPGFPKSWHTSFRETCVVDVAAFAGLSQGRITLISGTIGIVGLAIGLILCCVRAYQKWKLFSKQALTAGLKRSLIAGTVSLLVYGLANIFLKHPDPFNLPADVISLMSLPGVVVSGIIGLLANSHANEAFLHASIYSTSGSFWFLAGVVSTFLVKRNWLAIVMWIALIVGIEWISLSLLVVLATAASMR